MKCKSCNGTGKVPNPPREYDVWLYVQQVGWWLQESGYDNAHDAAGGLQESLNGPENDNGKMYGCIVPAGFSPRPDSPEKN